VAITDANTCVTQDSIKVSIRPDAVFTINPDLTSCLNDPVQLNASGGTSYSWQPAASLSNAGISNPFAMPAGSTNYTVTIVDNNCNESATLSTQVTIKPLPSIVASKSNDIDCSTNQSQLNASGGSQYSWSPASTLNNANIPNPVATTNVTTQYVVKGKDASGCTNYDSVIVAVSAIGKGLYLMPTGFTPNDDGLNDCYGVKTWGFITELQFSIYNRWGQRIFYTTNPNDCWDGRYKGVAQSSDVFVFMIKAKSTCESYIFRKGTFALIR